MTVARLDTAFARARDESRAALVTYFMAGDPGVPESLAVVRAAAAAGADVIELGFPFSDPMAEGPSIQRASQRALLHGTTLRDVLKLVREFREADGTTPIVLMGYLNPVLSYGYAAFGAAAAEAGVDGLIVVDCPPEEADELADGLDAASVALIRLATPTTDDQRLPAVVRRSSGFVYYVSVAGVTGVKAADAAVVAPEVVRVRAAANLPVAVGFGIRTPDQAAAVARVADGVVVGTALVEAVEQAAEAGGDPATAVGERVAALALAVRQARRTG